MSERLLGPLGFIRHCLVWLRPYRAQCALVGLTLLPAVAFCTVQPLLLKALVDEAVIPRDAQRATWLIVALAALLAVDAVMELVNYYLAARVGTRVTNDLRARLLEHFQRLSLSFYDRAQAGDLLARFTSDMEAIERALTRDLRAAAVHLLTIVVGFAVLFAVEWRLALLTLVFLPGIYLGPRLISARADRASYDRQQAGARLAAAVQENLAAQVVIKAFALQPLMLGRLGAHLNRLAARGERVGLLAGLQASMISATGSSLLVVTIGAGTFMAIRGELSVGSLVAFFELIWWMVSAVQRLSDVVLPFQQAAGGTQRIQEVLAEIPQVVDAPDAVAVPAFGGELRLEDVRFSYGDGVPSLTGLNLGVPAGRSIALVGPSGCGKSTVLGLMLRFRDPDGGRVTLDGVDLRRVSQASLRAQMAPVFQDSFLFDTTIRENIRLGRPEATDAEVEAAGRDAEIHEFVASLPQGYDTPVGERGARLSGGQRQRIALARAILRSPRILLLDEATSALDAQTEAAINATLERLGRERTVVSVTHRLASVVSADRIVVLSHGEIVEEGTHDQLLSRKGAYHRLWEQQSGFVVSPDGRRAAVTPARLGAMPAFAGIDEQALTDLAARFGSEHHPPGATIVEEGEQGDKLYVIVRGTLDVVQAGPDSVARPLKVMQDGDFFGEIALIDNVPRTATVRARTACLLLVLARQEFLGVMRTSPALRALFERAAHVRRGDPGARG
jgi:ATP-binding cassette subfamily B protein